MGKLACSCGEILSNSAVPNETEGYLISAYEGDDFDFKSLSLEDEAREFWECHTCGRLGVSFPGRHDATVKWYAPEDGKPGHLVSFTRLGKEDDHGG